MSEQAHQQTTSESNHHADSQAAPHQNGQGDIQLNLGHFSRHAGRDYHEHVTPDSIKMYLATTPSARLDAECMDNERLFKYRFGFDAQTDARKQYIELKHRLGATDDELLRIRRSGQMSIKRTDIKVAPDRMVPAVGWFFMTTYTLISLVCVWAISVSTVPSWRQALGLAAVGAMWLAQSWYVTTMHLGPWRLLKQLGVVAGGKSQ